LFKFLIDISKSFKFFIILKKLILCSIFLLFLSNFLFPELIKSFSNNIYLTEHIIDIDIEGELETEGESEELEELESDELFQDEINQPINFSSNYNINLYTQLIPLTSGKDICTPPPEIG